MLRGGLASRIFPDGKIAQPALAVFAFRFTKTKTLLRAASPDAKCADTLLLSTEIQKARHKTGLFVFCCGGRTCTCDLKVMSLASYYCSTPLLPSYNKRAPRAIFTQSCASAVSTIAVRETAVNIAAASRSCRQSKATRSIPKE